MPYQPLKVAEVHKHEEEPRMFEGSWLGTNARTEETLSLPVNALPAMLVNIANLVYVSRGIKRLTSLTLEEILIIDTENAK